MVRAGVPRAPTPPDSDSVLAYFGYPRAHEHDAERAVRAGPAVVETVPKLDAGAETLDCARKILRARCGEIQMVVVIGEVGLQIDKLRAGDVPLLELCAFHNDSIGLARFVNDIGRRVEDAEIRILEVCGEPVGVDQ